MSSSLVMTVAVLLGAAWLAFLGVSALRQRGREEVPPNIAAGRTDEELETRRLERIQQASVLLSAFLAVGMALYFLGESQRQESFVEEFDDASITRGEHIVAEFQCFNCHGPGGGGGSANYVEKRSGITVTWAAPSLNDIFLRYDRDEITFWITFGRGNTPMPGWGLAGNGPLSEKQVQDVVNYLESIQIPQQEVLSEIEVALAAEQAKLDGAQATVDAAIYKQRQLLADLNRAGSLVDSAEAVAERARSVLDTAGQGLDTDGDGISDAAEGELTALSAQLFLAVSPPGLAAIRFAPDNPTTAARPDAELAAEAVANLEALTESWPILTPQAEVARAALDAAGEGADADDDGLSDEAEAALTAAFTKAVEDSRPALTVVALDPTKTQSVGGQSDSRSAGQAVAAMEQVALQLRVSTDNKDKLVESARAGLDFLSDAASARRWEVDLQVVADAAFGGDPAAAGRAVGLFNGFCARCHTAGWSAGLPYTQEIGSGGFAPALFEGRPNVQFLTKESLVDFISKGSQGQTPYGANGFGTGRMPAFGTILTAEDIDLIATYLRSGNLDGKE